MNRRALIGLIALVALGSTHASDGAAESSGAVASRATITVRMGEFFFRPRNVTIRVGQSVRFLNVGKIEHTVADVDAHGTIRSKVIKPHALAHGQSQVVRFTRPGKVLYLCTFHPTLMKGTVTVTR